MDQLAVDSATLGRLCKTEKGLSGEGRGGMDSKAVMQSTLLRFPPSVILDIYAINKNLHGATFCN